MARIIKSCWAVLVKYDAMVSKIPWGVVYGFVATARLVYTIFADYRSEAWGLYFHTQNSCAWTIVLLKHFQEKKLPITLFLALIFLGLMIWDLTAYSVQDYASYINNERIAFWLFFLLLCSTAFIITPTPKKWR